MKKVHFFRTFIVPLFPVADVSGFVMPVDKFFWMTIVGKIVVGLILAIALRIAFFEIPDRMTMRENAPDVQ